MGKHSSGFLRSFFRNLLIILNIVAIVWLALCYVASFTPPASVRYLALMSLTVPFALAANFLFVIIWLFSRRKWWALLSVLALVFCRQMVPAVFGYHIFRQNDWSKTESSFKLMSWNVHAMGTFNNPNEKAYARGVMEAIKRESPDVLCLPEFAMSADSGKRVYPQKIMAENGYRYFRFNMDNGYGPHIWIGTAIFSRYPIVNYKAHQLSPYIYLVAADVQVNGNVVRIGMMHLQSFGLSDEDKAVIEEVKQEKNSESIAKSRSFIWKFNEAYIRRAAEAEKFRKSLDSSPYSVIVSCEFNDLPYSYTYRTIRGAHADAFAERGIGFGRTYNQIIPTLRIDHIFYSAEQINIKAFETKYSQFSDHSPVMANFELMRDTTN